MAGPHEVKTVKKWWQRALVRMISVFLKLYWSTLRVRFFQSAAEIMAKTAGPAIFAFWHCDLLMSPVLKSMLKKKFPIYGLISPSSDGAWLTAIFDSQGIKSIRGSSRRNGVSAISAAVEKLAGGASIAVTPDGPRGPAHKFKNGTAMIVQRAKVDVIMFVLKYGRHMALSTWDGFKIPMPFSKIHVDAKVLHREKLEGFATGELTSFLEAELKNLQSKLESTVA